MDRNNPQSTAYHGFAMHQINRAKAEKAASLIINKVHSDDERTGVVFLAARSGSLA